MSKKVLTKKEIENLIQTDHLAVIQLMLIFSWTRFFSISLYMIISMKLLFSSYLLSMKSRLNLTIDQSMTNELFKSEKGKSEPLFLVTSTLTPKMDL